MRGRATTIVQHASQATSSLYYYQEHYLSGARSNEVGREYSSSYSGIVYRLDSKYSVIKYNHVYRSPVISIHSQCYSGNTCDSDEFECANGNCIPQSYVCNDIDDCGDDSTDEQNCGMNECFSMRSMMSMVYPIVCIYMYYSA